MASNLNQSEVSTWYKRLNFVRTTEGKLSAITDSSASQTPLNAVSTLVSGIESARSGNAQLGVSDYAVTKANIASGQKVQETDKSAIDAAILSLLRICNNMTSQGTCTKTTKNQNESYRNGYNDCYNGNYLDGSSHSQSGYSNQCFNGTHGNGYYNYDGTHSNGGNNNESWSAATYSNKNHYTEEEALKRV